MPVDSSVISRYFAENIKIIVKKLSLRLSINKTTFIPKFM